MLGYLVSKSTHRPVLTLMDDDQGVKIPCPMFLSSLVCYMPEFLAYSQSIIAGAKGLGMKFAIYSNISVIYTFLINNKYCFLHYFGQVTVKTLSLDTLKINLAH